MPRRRLEWTRFSVRKRDQTKNLEHFHESINLGKALDAHYARGIRLKFKSSCHERFRIIGLRRFE